jgi:hypothetical protein
VAITFAWGLYKLGSNRMALGEKVMQIVSWGRIWTVSRGEVKSVVLADGAYSLTIILTDGSATRAAMFVASPLGVGYFRAGLSVTRCRGRPLLPGSPNGTRESLARPQQQHPAGDGVSG